ncbi:unnamed protein product, partial [Mesorhabditis spiculigera]
MRDCMTTWGWSTDGCICPMRCLERSFETTVSSAKWRIQSGTVIAQSLCNGDQCDETIDSAMLVNIYYESLNEKVTIESFSYPTINFMSDTAGQCGFWIGLSFLSLIEFVLLLWSIGKGVVPSPRYLIHLYYQRKYRNEQMTPNITPPSSSGISAVEEPEKTASHYSPPSRPTIAYTFRKKKPLGARGSVSFQ